MFCELFFRSCSFSTRVRAQVHVRSGLNAPPIAPLFSSRAPFPLFLRVLLGVAVSPCVRTPSCSSLPGPWNRVHSSLSWQPCSLSPFVFLAPRSCPVRRSCFRYPASPASVPRVPCAALRLLLPHVFAARPAVRASFLPSASPRSHVSHMCPHSLA